MTAPVELGPDSAADIARLSRLACEYDPLTVAEVTRIIFSDPDPQAVFGVYGAGLEAVGVAVVRGRSGYVKLLCVHPRLRRRGIASTVLDRIESFCVEKGAQSVTTGTCAPFYVTPGIDVRSTEALCLFQARGYSRVADTFNQSIRLTDLPDPALPVRAATPHDHELIRVWLSASHPNWLAEYDRSYELGTLIVHGHDGFACFDVNRDGWFGPMATRGGPRRSESQEGSAPRGVGTSTLLGCLHAMRRRGYEHADIAWVGPFAFYTKVVGARINRVFWSYRKTLPSEPTPPQA